MADAPADHFACPSCSHRYRWTPRIAGRAMRCPRCGVELRVPDQPGAASRAPAPPPEAGEGAGAANAEDANGHAAEAGSPAAPDQDGTYELDDPEAASAPSSSAPVNPPAGATLGASRAAAEGRCPQCNARLKPGAVVCLNCGYHLHEGRKVTTTIAEPVEVDPETDPAPEAAPGGPAPAAGSRLALAGRRGIDHDALDAQTRRAHTWQTGYIPALLAAGGLALLAINVVVLSPLAWHATPYLHGSPVSALVYSGYTLAYALVRLAIQVPVLMAGLVLLVTLMGASFGPLGRAVLKLTAIALVTGSVNDSIWLGLSILTGGFAISGFLLQWSITTAAFWSLGALLLEIEWLEVLTLWLFTIVAPVVATAFLASVILAII